MASTTASMATSSAGASAPLARALAYLFLRKKAALLSYTFEDSPAGSDPWATDRASFVKVGDDMLAHCKRTGQPLSIVVLADGDLAGPKGVEGVKQQNAELTAKLQRLAAPRGASMHTDVATFAVLLPGIGRDKAREALREVLGAVCFVDARVGAENIASAPDFLVQTVRREAMSIEEVYRVMRQDLSHAQQQVLSRKRFSLTGAEPSKVRSAAVLEDDARFAPAVRYEVTVPMPLRSR